MSDARTYLNRLLGRSQDTARVTAIPEVPTNADRGLVAFLTGVKEWIAAATGNGDPMAKLVSYADLVDTGVARVTETGAVVAGDSTLDYTPPPAPTGLTATGAMTNILLEWDDPRYANHAYTEIWANATDTLGTAVLVGTAPGALFPHAVGAGQTRYYWVRFVSTADVAGAYNASAGVVGATSNDPAWLLSTLSGGITTSQLATALNTRIDLIDAADTVSGSVAARIKTEAATRASEDESKASELRRLTAHSNVGAETDLRNVLNNAKLRTDTFAAITTEQTARATADSAIASDVTTLAARLNTGDVATAIAQSQTTANTGVTNAAAAQTTANSKVKTFFQTTAPTATTAGDLWVDTDDSNRIYRWSGTAWEDAHDARISSTASAVTTLQTTVGGHTTSIQTNASSIDGVKAQYTVKIDNSGYLSGFGLMSSLIGGGNPTSQFFVSANQFAVIAPGRTPGNLNSVPFAVLTTPQTINGVSFAAGVYIDGASINSGTIGNAQIGTAAVDSAKIADASIVEAKIGTAAVTSAKIGTAAIGSAHIATAAIQTAHIGDAQITEAKIGSAAITNAKIGNLAVDSAKIADASIVEAKIGSAAVTEAKIADAAITNAKIGNVIQSADYVAGSAGWKVDKAGQMEMNNATFRGTIKGGATEFLTGTGWFLGYSGGQYKFSIGDPSAAYMSWDGLNLSVKGNIINNTQYTAGGTLHSDLPQVSNIYVGQFDTVTLKSWTCTANGTITVNVDLAYAAGFTAVGLDVSVKKNGTIQGGAYVLTQVDPTYYTLSRSFAAAIGDIITVVAATPDSPTYCNVKNLTVTIASVNVIAASQALFTMAGSTYTLAKKIQMPNGGVVQVTFDLRTVGGTAYGRIYKNGVAVGTERTTSSSTFVSWSENITFAANDTIELWIRNSTTNSTYNQRFELAVNQALTTPVALQ